MEFIEITIEEIVSLKIDTFYMYYEGGYVETCYINYTTEKLSLNEGSGILHEWHKGIPKIVAGINSYILPLTKDKSERVLNLFIIIE